jgi:outer membrane protein
MSNQPSNQAAMRRIIAVLLAWACATPQLTAQEPQQVVQRPQASVFIRPYKSAKVPEVQLHNGDRIHQLIRAGKLYLTVQDAIALSIENNLDLEIDRYGPVNAQWSLERALAGGPLRGINGGNSIVNQATSGQGVQGALSAAGLSISSGGSSSNGTNAVVSQIGPVTPNLDPVLQNSTVFYHVTTPYANVAISQLYSVLDSGYKSNTVVQQGLITGGYVQTSLNYSYLNENAPSDITNPSYAPQLQVYVRHNFLQGFGKNVNNIYIRGARLGVTASFETFRSQLLNTVATTLNLYWDLVSNDDELKVRQRALDAAQKTLEDTRHQIELGVVAKVEEFRAASGVATGRQALAVAESNVRQQELLLKNAISRNGLEDPLIEAVDIVPLDRIEIPEQDELPPLRDLLTRALAHRPDVALSKISDEQQEISSIGTKNIILPTLIGIGSVSDLGNAGPYNPASGEPPPTALLGGAGAAFAQVFRHNYPTNRAVAYFTLPLFNHQAQGDYGIDQLQLKQSDVVERRNMNQIVVDISNQMVALRQARARYSQATASHTLQADLLEKEHQMFSFGSATLGDVVAAQGALLAAESAEVTAASAYSHARIALDQVLGETLERNHISVDDALNGRVSHHSTPPPATP